MFDESAAKLSGDILVLVIYLVTLFASIFFAGKKWREQVNGSNHVA